MMMRRKSTLSVIDSCAIGVTGSGKSQMEFAHARPEAKRKRIIPDNSGNCFSIFLVTQEFEALGLLSKQKGRASHLLTVCPSWLAASNSFMACSPPRLFLFLDLLKPPAPASGTYSPQA